MTISLPTNYNYYFPAFLNSTSSSSNVKHQNKSLKGQRQPNLDRSNHDNNPKPAIVPPVLRTKKRPRHTNTTAGSKYTFTSSSIDVACSSCTFHQCVSISILVFGILFVFSSEFIIQTELSINDDAIDAHHRNSSPFRQLRLTYILPRLKHKSAQIVQDDIPTIRESGVADYRPKTQEERSRTVYLVQNEDKYQSLIQQPQQHSQLLKPLKRYLGLHQQHNRNYQKKEANRIVNALLHLQNDQNSIGNEKRNDENMGEGSRRHEQRRLQYEIDFVDSTIPDYGNLIMTSALPYVSTVLQTETQSTVPASRTVRVDDNEQYDRERWGQLDWIDDNTYEENSEKYHVEGFYFYDDDVIYQYEKAEDQTEVDHCQRPRWTYDIYPTCNQFHESVQYHSSPDYRNKVEGGLDSQNVTSSSFVKFIDSGYFRDSYLLNSGGNDVTVVLKSLRYHHVVDPFNIHKINNEAVVMERLSSSKYTMTMYGHCGTSIVVEHGYEIYDTIVPYRDNGERKWSSLGRIQQRELDQIQELHNDIAPMNQLSNEEKLDISIVMAQSIAELHGYIGGVITMDDIEDHQWLSISQPTNVSMTDQNGTVHQKTILNPKSIKLNDFGNSRFLQYNTKKEMYCKYWAAYSGSFRAPEEYDENGSYVDESVDVWPVGNLIFTLLTGLYPYYFLKNDEKIQKLTQISPPYLDIRYSNHTYIEHRLYTIMKRCHKIDPTKRVSIFDVVQYLQKTKSVFYSKLQYGEEESLSVTSKVTKNKDRSNDNHKKLRYYS